MLQLRVFGNVFCWLECCRGQGSIWCRTFLIGGHSRGGAVTHPCAIPPLLLSQKPCWEFVQHFCTKLTAYLRVGNQLGQGFCVLSFGADFVVAKGQLKCVVVTGNSGYLCGDTVICALRRAATKSTPGIKNFFLTRN